MEGINTILTRRSIRKYEEKPVEREKIEAILRAGMYAPSAHNSQPWEFIVVQDRDTLKAFSKMQYWGMLQEAALAVVTVANTKDYGGSSLEFFIQDCSAATENMLLAAHDLGLGGVWLGLYGNGEKMAAVRKALCIPEEIRPFSVIALGYPAEQKNPHTVYREDKVHYEKYCAGR